MKKRYGKIGTFVVFGLFMAIMLSPSAIAALEYEVSTDDDGVGVENNEEILFDMDQNEIEILGAAVGIGDTSPDFKLEVTGSSGDGYFGVSSTDDEDDNGDIFIIDGSGNVGIGQASPSAKLDVVTSSGGAATIGSSGCSATGDYAIAMGYDTTATNQLAFATGFLSDASGIGSIAMGWDADASGDTSYAIGNFVTASAEYSSFVIGSGVGFGYPLVNDIPSSLMVGFDSTTPTLFVDGSSVGIGTTTPGGKLEIQYNSGPQLLLTYGNRVTTGFETTSDGYLYIKPTGMRVGILIDHPASTLSVAGEMTVGGTWANSYSAPSDGMIIEGSVGIGVINPGEALEIEGNILFNYGSARNIYVETPTTNNDGKDLTIEAGDCYWDGLDMYVYDGGDIKIIGGDSDGGSGAGDPGDIIIYGGISGWPTSPPEGNVILAHTGTTARGRVGIGTTSPDDTFEIEWAAAVDCEIGRGTTDTDITFLRLRNAEGEICYIYPNASQDGIIVTGTHP